MEAFQLRLPEPVQGSFTPAAANAAHTLPQEAPSSVVPQGETCSSKPKAPGENDRKPKYYTLAEGTHLWRGPIGTPGGIERRIEKPMVVVVESEGVFGGIKHFWVRDKDGTPHWVATKPGKGTGFF